jgi:hypothetical protein
VRRFATLWSLSVLWKLVALALFLGMVVLLAGGRGS